MEDITILIDTIILITIQDIITDLAKRLKEKQTSKEMKKKKKDKKCLIKLKEPKIF